MYTTDLLPISVVVIGRNEGDRLVRCLESLRAAEYDPDRLELIYVDTNSTDASCANAERFAARVIRINPERPCAAAARNAGFRAATHDLVHFFDGDTIVHPAWFRTAVPVLADPAVACVFGQRTEIAPRATIYNFWTHHDWYVPPGPAHHCAGDALFRREVLERTNGFDETLIAGEEPDLCYRIRRGLGMIILALDAPMTRHDMNMTRFAQYWRRCTRTGHAYAEVGARYPDIHWNRERWRDPLHILLAAAALLGTFLSWSPWPIVAWMALLSVLITRNALRLRRRVGSLPSAWLYAVHHYLAKLPITLGEFDYWRRRLFKRTPKPLIEYR